MSWPSMGIVRLTADLKGEVARFLAIDIVVAIPREAPELGTIHVADDNGSLYSVFTRSTHLCLHIKEHVFPSYGAQKTETLFVVYL